ncbi:hypothetical protein TBR22_A13450 [Luteitalea sp. TBR-22]|uniref:Os1348 family NHLP clan protein n=1 Tax=Luteitalea sp. TBR-22 TaxID=2802971 RepID=UPI001AFBCF84|nr:Os1348 family NHLP clan protein [Luteitalea sp. TBR-22]BCS32136.1 hypothetical protein TBR22_A13450 [Luteitalea sp. TBR-22]
MSQRNVEWFLGRLLTDEDLRTAFLGRPRETLLTLQQQGLDLTRGEVDALVAADPAMWRDLASRVPSCLRRCSLRTE